MCIVYSVENTCRLCLSESEEKLSIFDPQFCNGIPLSMKIMVCVSLTVTPEDSLPKMICTRCTNLINAFYEFREECINTHMKLMQYGSNDTCQMASPPKDPDPGGEDQQETIVKDDLMYTEALQENDNEFVEKNYLEEIKIEDGSLETVTVICGKYEDVEQTIEVSGKESIEYEEEAEQQDDQENEKLVLRMSSSEDSNDLAVPRSNEVNSVKIEENVSDNLDVSCFMQLEKVSDTVYILKPVDTKDEQAKEMDGEGIEDEEGIEESSGLRKRYKCAGCIRVFSTQGALDKHWNICKQEQTVNSNEEKTLEVETEFQENHVKQKRARWGEGRTYPCPTCGKVFKVPAMLRTHERVHTGERPFLCSLCSRSFTQLYALRNHEQQHRGESPYPCEQCGKGFFRPSDLEKHMRSHTGERPYMCSMCSKAFHQLSGLVVHERIHTGERPYSCSFCSMTCNQWANMQRHEKTHAGGTKPYSCDVCHRKFSDRKELELHHAGHGGGRPRVCQYCSKSFRKPSELRHHLRRTHTNERPYQCEFCNKAFFVAHELKQHLMIHTGERPFACHYCDRTFTQKGNLKRHVDHHHKDEDIAKEEANLIIEEVNMEDMQLTELETESVFQQQST